MGSEMCIRDRFSLSCRYFVVHARILKAFLFAKSYGVIIIEFLMFLTYRLTESILFFI